MIYNAIETGSKFGMVTLDTALADLIKRGLVEPEIALSKAYNQDQVRMRAGLPQPGPSRL